MQKQRANSNIRRIKEDSFGSNLVPYNIQHFKIPLFPCGKKHKYCNT
jgi:hypothetical protein